MNTADLEAISQGQYAEGIISLESSMEFLCRAVFAEGYGGEFQQVDNDVLVTRLMTDADLEGLERDGLTRPILSTLLYVANDRNRFNQHYPRSWSPST